TMAPPAAPNLSMATLNGLVRELAKSGRHLGVTPPPNQSAPPAQSPLLGQPAHPFLTNHNVDLRG
ncbi:MAG: hypothetical protein ACRDGF_07490, partial [Chloroflexota bacterium]